MKVRHYIYAVFIALFIAVFGLLSLKAANVWIFSDSRSLNESKNEPAIETKEEPKAVKYSESVSEPVCPPDTNPPTLPQPDINPLSPNPNNPFYLNNPPGVGQNIIYDPITNTYNFQYMTGNTPFGPGAYMNT